MDDPGRKAILKQAVRERTREYRATVRDGRDFEAILTRTTPPPRHALHFAIEFAVVLVCGLGVANGWALSGIRAAAITLGAPVAYALFWLLLAGTAGTETETLAVDDQGRISSVRTGRAPETRTNAMRVLIPSLIALASGLIAAGLVLDLVFPPLPVCTLPAVNDSDPCVMLPGLLSAQTGGLSRGGYAILLQNMRLLALILTLCFCLPSLWFLRRMLTGRRVLGVRPINRRDEDPEAPTSFPGPDGWLMALVVAVLCAVLIGSVGIPIVSNSLSPTSSPTEVTAGP